MKTLHLLAVLATFSLAAAHLQFEERDLDAFDIRSDEASFDSEPVFQGDEQGAFLGALLLEKNATAPPLQDRSMELYKRQQCETGYGYCARLGGCCPSDNKCCSYGYCLEPGKTCCPNGPCAVGSTCCGNNKCHPEGTQCCSDGHYCEAGNMCVIFRGEMGCCTDLKCTARVESGTTVYATTTTPAAPPTTTPAAPPTITQPPLTTQVIADSFTTYYWTVRWRYFSYYWYVFGSQSTVTYTTITFTTIYTTTATDETDASSVFAELSKTLTFSTPAEATTLASLVGAVPSPTATPTTALETELDTSEGVLGPTSVEVFLAPSDDDATSSPTQASTSRTSSRGTSSTSAPPTFTGGASAAGSVAVQTMFMVLAVLSGIMMVWL